MEEEEKFVLARKTVKMSKRICTIGEYRLGDSERA